MKWSLNELQKYRNEPTIISGTADLRESLMERDKEILDVSPVRLEGKFEVREDEVSLQLIVSLELTLPSARSLVPVLFPMSIGINETYIPKYAADYKAAKDDDELVIYLEDDVIDLSEPVEDAIILNLPLQVFTEEEEKSNNMPKGTDWAVVSEEEYFSEAKQTETGDPRLAGLKNLFNNDTDDQDEE